MRIYDDREKQVKNACGYCRQTGHNVSVCPHVAPDWASWQRFEVPMKNPDCWVHTIKYSYGRPHWFTQPKYWGDWYNAAKSANQKQELVKMKASSPRQSRGPRNCGFCGEEGHTRRKCAELLAFRQKANRANQAIRHHVYNKLVTEHGLSIGALIEPKAPIYDYSKGGVVNKSLGVCTVTSINWDQVSVTTDGVKNSGQKIGYELQTPIIVKYIDPEGIRGSLQLDINKGIVGEENRDQWSRSKFIGQVISPSPTPLDAGWVRQARQDAFDWLSNKRNKAWMDQNGITDLVDRWSAKYVEMEEGDAAN